MNNWSENIQFSAPLREARLGTAAAAVAETSSSNESWQAGFEAGRIAGEQALSGQLLKQRNDLHELVNGVLNSLREAVPQVIRDTENTLVSVALEVAQKLVSDMPISVPMLEATVRDALTQIEGAAEFTVRLHPADLELLKNADSPLLISPDESSHCRFLSSPEVGRGGCLVQTRFGTVDARRETKFDLIKRSLVTC